jgi:hypothetical protein
MIRECRDDEPGHSGGGVRQGFIGSYLVQELKRTCHEMDKVPAARCDASNTASRATLQRAGMLPCASILTGDIRPGL